MVRLPRPATKVTGYILGKVRLRGLITLRQSAQADFAFVVARDFNVWCEIEGKVEQKGVIN